MVKIDKISIDNFKNVQKADVLLGDFNVLIGANGSGKSNLLKVIGFLDLYINGSKDELNSFIVNGYNTRFGRILPDPIPSNFKDTVRIKIEFSSKKTGDKYIYYLEVGPSEEEDEEVALGIVKESFSFKKKSQKGNFISVFYREGEKFKIHADIKKFLAIDTFSINISGIKLLTLINQVLDEKFKNAIDALQKVLSTKVYYLSPHELKSFENDLKISHEGRMISYDLESEIIALSKTDKWPVFLRLADEILNFNRIAVEKHKVSPDFDKEYIFYFRMNRISIFRDLSDGSIIILGLLVQILTDKSYIFFLEELENSLHPKALSELIKYIKSCSIDKQFLITTHSVSLVNMVSPEEVLVAEINDIGLSEISGVKNIKEIKKKLSKSFLSFGEILFNEDEKKFEEFY